MSRQEISRARVEIDGQQAHSQLDALREKARRLRTEIQQMRVARDPGLAQKQREFKALNNKIVQMSRNSYDLNRTLRNLSGSSMKDLTKAQTLLTAQIRHGNRSTAQSRAELNKKAQQLRQVRSEIARVRAQMTGMNTQMNFVQRVAHNLNKYFLAISATLGMLTGIIMGLRQAVNLFNEFEHSVAALSAITGLAGRELQWLEQRAKQSSIAVGEMGIRFTNSAKDIVDAYTLIGSKRPELLQDREALAHVTEQAMILSKAANIELEPAAAALTTTMNQFGASASEARRIINVLGAGSKVGAANVAYLNQVIERTGTSAMGSKMTIEELVGVIEGIAPRFSNASEAGTSLRLVLLKLLTGAEETNPAVVGLSQALDNLANKNLTPAELNRLFGVRGVNMAQALIDGREDILRYTEAVTDSNVALEQAAIMSNINAAALEQARNRAALLRIELGERFAPAMTFSTNSISYFLRALKELIDNWGYYRRIIIGIAGAMVIYNAQKLNMFLYSQRFMALLRLETAYLKAKAITQGVATVAAQSYNLAIATMTKNKIAAAKASEALSVAMMKTPWGLIAKLIGVAAGALFIYYQNKKRATDALGEFQQLQKEATDAYDKEAAEIKRHMEIVQNNNVPLEHRIASYERLKELIPELSDAVQKEGEAMVVDMRLVGRHLQALRDQIEFETLGEQLNQLHARQIANRRALADAEIQQGLNNTRRNRRAVAEARENYQITEDLLEQVAQRYEELSEIVDANTDSRKENIDPLKLLTELLDDEIDTIEHTTTAYQRLTQQISEATAQMMHFITLGEYSMSMSYALVKETLEAQKLVIDGIAEYGGNVHKFIENLSDSTQSELEETLQFQEMFFENWSQGAQDWEDKQEQRHKDELERERKEHESKLEFARIEREFKAQQAVELADTQREILAASLGHGFDLYTQHLNREYDIKYRQLDNMMRAEIANEDLTEEQKEAIRVRFQERKNQLQQQEFIRRRRADVIQSIINTALSVSRALAAPPGWPFNKLSVAKAAFLGSAQTIAIRAQPVPQFAKGKYQVVGEQDKKTYNAQYIHSPKTGFYSRPALFAETGEELIIDPFTTRNLKLNYPHIIQGILAARHSGFAHRSQPLAQYAQGNLDQIQLQGNPSLSLEDIAALSMAIENLFQASEHLRKEGVKAHLCYTDLMRFKSTVDTIKTKASL